MENVKDKLEIVEVMTKYAAGIDTLDFDLYSSCFSKNVELHGFGVNKDNGEPKVIKGIDAWITYVKEAISKYSATQHLLGNPLIKLTDNKAYVRTDVQARHYLKDPEGAMFCLWAVYNTEMEKDGGKWKITNHRLTSIGSKLDNPE
jgi:hypothetical protein